MRSEKIAEADGAAAEQPPHVQGIGKVGLDSDRKQLDCPLLGLAPILLLNPGASIPNHATAICVVPVETCTTLTRCYCCQEMLCVCSRPACVPGCVQGAGKGGKRLRVAGADSSVSGHMGHEASGSVPPGPNMMPRDQVGKHTSPAPGSTHSCFTHTLLGTPLAPAEPLRC